MSEAAQIESKQWGRDLPIFRTAIRAVVLPFVHLIAFVRFASIPFAVDFAIVLIVWIMPLDLMSENTTTVIKWIANAFVFTPFAVTWFRLATLGPRSISKRAVLRWGKVEFQLLLAYAVLMIAMAATLGAPAKFYRWASTNWYVTRELGPLVAASMLAVAGIIITLTIFLLCAFVFPSIAIQRYAGFRKSLDQVLGCVERIFAIEVIAVAPWAVIYTIVGHREARAQSNFIVVMFEFAKGIAHAYVVAVSIGGVGLSYKFAIMDRRSTEPLLEPSATRVEAAAS